MPCAVGIAKAVRSDGCIVNYRVIVITALVIGIAIERIVSLQALPGINLGMTDIEE